MSSLLDFFRRLLGRSRPSPAPAQTQQGKASAQFQALNQLAPLKAEPSAPAPAPTPTNRSASFICREPVLNRQEQIAGYFFHLHGHLQSRLQGKNEPLHKAYDDALLRNLLDLHVHRLLGHRKAFIHLSPASLDNPLLARLPVKNSVLMLSPNLNALDLELLQPQLAALRQAGMAHGWVLDKNLLALHPALRELAMQADYVQLDTAKFDGLEIEALCETLGNSPAENRAPLQWIAQELHSFDEFNLCFKGGFDFFMGDFVTSRENWHPPKSEINRLLTIKLLNLLRSDEDLSVIAQQITADPVLAFKLLRYLNSPAFGLSQPILTIDKAVMVLGRERCYRWVSLLLFDIQQSGYRERVLIEHALTRAFYLESLAGQGLLQGPKEELFILGLFSMLDLLIGHPLETILQETHLPAPVHRALLGQAGTYRNALLLAQAMEKQQFNAVQALAERLQLNALPVLSLQMEALGKANEIIEMSQE